MCRHVNVSNATRMPQDLILWEYVRLEFPTCLVKLPLSCGEIPDGMHLPRSCKNIGMPATFMAFGKTTGENAEDGEVGTVEGEIPENYPYVLQYVVKFFENGEYSVQGRPGVDPGFCLIMTRGYRQSSLL